MWKQENDLFWLSAAANFNNDKQDLGKLLENESIYMEKKLTTNSTVPGWLCRDHKFAELYKEVLNADDKIVKMISQGYKVLLDKEPPPAKTKNNKSCLRNLKFTVQELKRL